MGSEYFTHNFPLIRNIVTSNVTFKYFLLKSSYTSNLSRGFLFWEFITNTEKDKTKLVYIVIEQKIIRVMVLICRRFFIKSQP